MRAGWIIVASLCWPQVIWPCSCGGQPLFCNHPLPDGPNEAVFIGTVSNVYPRSLQSYTEMLASLARPLIGVRNPALEDQKQMLLRMWQGVLTPQEEERLHKATSADDLRQPLGGIYWSMPRRARLDISEQFSGPAAAQFEVFTGPGSSGDCAVDFEPGENYLVIARRTGSGRWMTDICSGSQRLSYTNVKEK